MGTKRVMRSGKKIAPPVSNKFNFIQETLVRSNGLKTKVWTLPPAEMYAALNDSDTDSDGSEDFELYPTNFGVGVNPHESGLPNSSDREQEISVGRPNLGFTRRCKLNYLRKRRMRQRLEQHKLIKKPAFNFTQDTLVSASGVKTKVWTLPPAEMYSALNDSDTDSAGSEDFELYPTNFGIGTRRSNPPTPEAAAHPPKEQKELLFRSIADLLQKNGLSLSADVLMLEAGLKKDGGATTPPDIEGFLLEFLKKGESNVEKLNEVESSLEMLRRSISHNTCDQEDDIFSKYTSEDPVVSESTEFLRDRHLVSIEGMHERTVKKDVVKFFQDASIKVDVAGVKLYKPKRNFRDVLEKSGTVRFRNPEDTKNADSLNGSFMKIRKMNSGSFVFISRVKNSMRVLCVSGFERDDDASVKNELKGFFESNRRLQIVLARPVAQFKVCYVLVKAISEKSRRFLKNLDGRIFTCNGLAIREVTLKPIIFNHLFGSVVED